MKSENQLVNWRYMRFRVMHVQNNLKKREADLRGQTLTIGQRNVNSSSIAGAQAMHGEVDCDVFGAVKDITSPYIEKKKSNFG